MGWRVLYAANYLHTYINTTRGYMARSRGGESAADLSWSGVVGLLLGKPSSLERVRRVACTYQ